jgi:hypothetical protein
MNNKPENDLQFNPNKMLKSIVSAALGNGVVKPEHFLFTRTSNTRPMIIVAAAPRSGSTFLSNVLSQVTRLNYFRLCSGYGTNEHDLYLPALCLLNDTGCVSQMHMKGTYHNASLLNLFSIKPVILVRNIFDIIVSLHQDLRKKEALPGYDIGLNGYSFLWLDSTTRDMDDEQLLDMVIDLAIPWYVNFYVSWYRLCRKNAVHAMWITYEHLMTNKEKTVQSILHFLGYPVPSAIDPVPLNKKYDTFHKGKIGQGNVILSEDRKIRVKKLFSYYPDVNFDKFGLQDITS